MEAAIRAVWERNLPVTRERLRVLEVAAANLEAGVLGETERAVAEGEAHKLAGSLGMFGFGEGTVLARELEVGFERGDGDVAAMRALVGKLRGELGL